MKLSSKVNYCAVMVFDDDAIRRMFRMEYDTYKPMRRLTWLCIAAVLILLAVFTKIPDVVKVLCLFAGCWLITCRDFASRVQAEGVLEKRGGISSNVSLRFADLEIYGDSKLIFSYQEVDKLVEDTDYYYIFKDRQSAVMVPKLGLRPNRLDDFRSFMEKKTNKKWRKNGGRLRLKKLLNRK